jgi:hypothetical protein
MKAQPLISRGLKTENPYQSMLSTDRFFYNMPIYSAQVPVNLLIKNGLKASHLYEGSDKENTMSMEKTLVGSSALKTRNDPNFVIIPSREALHVFDCKHLCWVLSEPSLGYSHLMK